MADDAAASAEEVQITFNVKAANDNKHTLTLPNSTTVADLKAQLAKPEFVDLPPERQRLIYSGRVLKDHDTLGGVKIKDGHTVHLVKGAASNARQNPASQGAGNAASGGAPVPQVPTNIAAGTGNNPLAGLTGARYAGFHGLPGADMFGPDGGMGPPPNQEELLRMMDNPMFLQQMNEAMDNPAVIDMMAQNPMVRNNPMLAQMLRNPEMRRAMFNPEMMRAQLQLQRAMGEDGASSFAMPGATNTTPQNPDAQNQPSAGTANQQNPLAALFGAGGGGGDMFANAGFGSAFAPPSANPTATGADANTSSTEAAQNTGGSQNTSPPQPPANPFASLFGAPPTAGSGQQPANPIADIARNMMQNPDAMRAAMQMFGGQGGAGGGFGGFPGGFGDMTGMMGAGGAGTGVPAPPDNRPPEEIYEVQLRQLNEMGFYEFDRNVAALRRSGGNVQGAIEHLLSGGS